MGVVMAARNLSILTRQFSTSTTNRAVVKTPIPVYGIEGRYSAALFSAASKNKALDTVEGDLKKLQGAMKSDARFSQFLLDPTVKTGLKIDGLTGASKKLGFNDLTKNLLFALAENNRVGYLDAVVSSFGALMAAHRGEVVCSVTTAKPLDAAIKKEVEGFVKGNQKALINYSVDASIIGGMVISVGDKFCDMSMSSKLKKYSELIKGAA